MKKYCITNHQGKCKSTTMKYHLISVYQLKGQKTNAEEMKKLQYWHTAVRENAKWCTAAAMKNSMEGLQKFK